MCLKVSKMASRTDLEIHRLKDQVCGVSELDDLATHQTQLLVVIQHSVHVLNPHCVDGPVKDDPLPFWGVC